MSKLLKSKILLGVMIVAVMLVAGGLASTVKAECSVSTLMKVGSRSADVTCLQTKLGMTTVTGYFGTMTKAKVQAFQATKGLTADGVVGAATRAALNAEVGGGEGTPTGCENGALFNPMTGASCSTTPTPTGCENGALFNPMTGASCTATPTPTPSGTAGDINLSSTTTDVETQVVEGSTTNVLGFKVEASGSDVSLSNLKVSLKNKGTSVASYRLSNVASEVSVYMGSTKVGSALVSDFSKDTTSAGGVNVYSKSIALTDATVKSGLMNKQTFYVKVTALSNIDSTDMNSDNWAVLVDNIRFQDGTGVVMTSGDSVGSITTGRFEFADLATSGDVKVVVSKAGTSPVEQNRTVSTTSSTKDIPVLEFKVKATGSTASFDSLVVTTALVTTGAGDSYSTAIGSLRLVDGSGAELATIEGVDLVEGANTFTLEETKVIEVSSTGETFKVLATVNKGVSANFTSGLALTASFTSFSPEDTNGGIISDTGTATGSKQTFVYNVPVISLVSASLPSTPTTHTDGTAAGEEDTYTATIKFDVQAPENAPVYVPKDSFAYGTAGTAGVLYSVTGGATVVSANVQYSGVDNVTSISETNTYRVDADSSQQFTLTVVLKGNDAYGKLSMTGLWYELSDTTPNNSPLVSGLTTLYTPGVNLAK